MSSLSSVPIVIFFTISDEEHGDSVQRQRVLDQGLNELSKVADFTVQKKSPLFCSATIRVPAKEVPVIKRWLADNGIGSAESDTTSSPESAAASAPNLLQSVASLLGMRNCGGLKSRG